MIRKVQWQCSISEPRQRASHLPLLFAMLLVLSVIGARSAQAQTFTVLYTFTGRGDGGNPQAGVIGDERGNLYGTTHYGGAFDYGTVFKLDPKPAETVLHSFTGADGAWPAADLIRDAAGNLYGTTLDGGTSQGGQCTHGCGTVFRVDKTGKETALYAFTGKADGRNPQTSLARTPDGTLYGTTFYGGYDSPPCNYGGCGTAFEVDKNGKETVLHAFTGGSDGAWPYGGMITDKLGSLYGTASQGGTSANCPPYGCGIVFRLNKTGKQTVLYNFGGPPDGALPVGNLALDSNGNLYGATVHGGDSSCDYGEGCGVVFKLDKSGTMTVLHAFTGGADGSFPEAGLIRDAAGNLYGTTSTGGSTGESCSSFGGCGVVFKVDMAGDETVLYSFTKGKDGAFPFAGLVQDSAGNLYGTAEGGASGACQGGCGVVFKLTP